MVQRGAGKASKLFQFFPVFSKPANSEVSSVTNIGIITNDQTSTFCRTIGGQASLAPRIKPLAPFAEIANCSNTITSGDTNTIQSASVRFSFSASVESTRTNIQATSA